MYVVFTIHNSDPLQTLPLIKDKVSLEYYQGVRGDLEHLVVTETEAPVLEALLEQHGLDYTKGYTSEIPDPMMVLDFLMATHPDLSEPSED